MLRHREAGEELVGAPPVEALTRFIEAGLPRLEALAKPDDAAGDVDELNASSAATRSLLEKGNAEGVRIRHCKGMEVRGGTPFSNTQATHHVAVARGAIRECLLGACYSLASFRRKDSEGRRDSRGTTSTSLSRDELRRPSQ